MLISSGSILSSTVVQRDLWGPGCIQTYTPKVEPDHPTNVWNPFLYAIIHTSWPFCRWTPQMRSLDHELGAKNMDTDLHWLFRNQMALKSDSGGTYTSTECFGKRRKASSNLQNTCRLYCQTTKTTKLTLHIWRCVWRPRRKPHCCSEVWQSVRSFHSPRESTFPARLRTMIPWRLEETIPVLLLWRFHEVSCPNKPINERNKAYQMRQIKKKNSLWKLLICTCTWVYWDCNIL